jgi:hypothetical protein
MATKEAVTPTTSPASWFALATAATSSTAAGSLPHDESAIVKSKGDQPVKDGSVDCAVLLGV